MRRFFLVLSVFVLAVLITVGVHQKVTSYSIKDMNIQEIGVLHGNF